MKQAMAAAEQAKALFAQMGFCFGAPEGYFCEMLKTEEHMTKIHRKEQATLDALKASAEARKQRALKKFSKQVQTETLAKRAANKKEELAKIAQLRKKRKHADANDDFDVDIEEAMEDGPVEKRKVIKGGKKVMVEKKVSAKRQYKNSKFGFGGKKWDKKKNTRDSTDNFEFNPSKNKRSFGNTKTSKGKGGKAVRPGKQRRQNIRSKAGNKKR